MFDKNVDFMRKTDGEEVEGNTLPTQQNKNSSGLFELVPDCSDILFGLLCLRIGARFMKEFLPLIRGEVYE